MSNDQIKVELGKQFGNWKVLERIGIRHKCLCKCGIIKNILTFTLTNGDSKSCGCSKKVDHNLLVGKKYGLLTVLNLYKWEKQGKNKPVPYYTCKCDCGVVKNVKGMHLRTGDTKSCGCFKPNKLGEGIASFNYLLTIYKRHAKNRNYVWELNKEEFYKLTKSNCYYCKSEPHQLTGSKRCNGKYLYNGVDRLNNEPFYRKDNTVSCCGKCNRMKSDIKYEDFINHLTKIVNNL